MTKTVTLVVSGQKLTGVMPSDMAEAFYSFYVGFSANKTITFRADTGEMLFVRLQDVSFLLITD